MVRLSERAVYSVRSYGALLLLEQQMQGRIGIHHDVAEADGAACWLRIDRLKRHDPPEPSESIRRWITVARDPHKAPSVQAVLCATVPQADADTLVRDGRAAPDDVTPALRPPKDAQGPMADVLLRLDRHPEDRLEIDRYLHEAWTPWSEAEKPRRETIAIYDELFTLHQQMQTGAADRPLEIVWGTGMARWKTAKGEIEHPLIEQLVEVEVDADTMAIRVRPRQAAPTLAMKPYFDLQLPGADTVVAIAKTTLAAGAERDLDFSPFIRASFEPILRQAVANLDPGGRYHPDTVADATDRSVPPAERDLAITDTWAIYARPRSDNYFLDDLERLKAAIETAGDLPGPARRIVEEASDVSALDDPIFALGGSFLGSGAASGAGMPRPPDEGDADTVLFFPTPFNDDQVQIIRRLDKADGGVVCQGPPGTGKTHTIANIICHYLATGRRVLVTSKGEAALTVLRNQIPEGIRDLTISLLTSEREGLKQLETTVALLANTATRQDPYRLLAEITDGEREVARIKARIAEIDQEMVDFAEQHLRPIRTAGGEAMPYDLAQRVVNGRERYGWLTDRPDPDAAGEPRFGDTEIAALREARRALGADLDYLGRTLPSLPDLPDTARISAAHSDLVQADALARQLAEGAPVLAATVPDAVARARSLMDQITTIAAFHDASAAHGWAATLFATWRRRGVDAAETSLAAALVPTLGAVVKQRHAILRHAVELPHGAHLDGEFVEAVERAANGQRAFGLVAFGKGAAKAAFAQVRIAGRAPETAEDWRAVLDTVCWRRDLGELTARWNAAALECGLPVLDADADAARRLAEFDEVLSAAFAIACRLPALAEECRTLFPYGLDFAAATETAAAARAAAAAIMTNVASHQFAASRDTVSRVLDVLAPCAGRVVEEMRAFVETVLGRPEHAATAVADRWHGLCRELNRISDLRHHLRTVDEVCGHVAASGAPGWAQRLRGEPAGPGEDTLLPADWRDAWEWARLDAHLRRIDDRERLRALSEERIALDQRLQAGFAEVVRLRTYLGLKKTITERVEQALSMFMSALKHIGKGTGKRAVRHRSDARDAMERSYSAIPCWIMPHHRVSEHLPSQLGTFDLVIVDEASQSDVTALPVLLRGKHVLVVGDDKQVSPIPPIIEEKKLVQLRHSYLQGQPFAPLLMPGMSLYDLCLAIFPGRKIMLREHFRCVEPIINFSRQFYTEELIPVRLPRASERLDPPLIDIFVPHGKKLKNQTNLAEAAVIVDEIARIVEDPAMAERSIGVISLIGAKQAQLVHARLLERVGEETMQRHRITCGDSSTLQGEERDIVFLSMVECPASQSAKTTLMFQQRFNVALSRARDRMVLVRSVSDERLRPDDLKAKVIRHFREPMKATAVGVEDLIELCDSGFERTVFRYLAERGYRVTPQVKVGPYSIDLVVEGERDSRLAIELDGDKYHGPERWADDLRRQRTLERVGWRFWRCWGSSHILDPQGCMDDLERALSAQGIAPLGFDGRPNLYTEHRVIGPEGETVEALDQTEADAGDDDPGDGPVVTIGDRVLLRYNDDSKRLVTITISATEHDPDLGVVRADHAMGQSLLGHAAEEEVEIPAPGGGRLATIMSIEKVALVLEAA